MASETSEATSETRQAVSIVCGNCGRPANYDPARQRYACAGCGAVWQPDLESWAVVRPQEVREAKR